MTRQYLVHLTDGSEYGPVDRATLASWRDEGRLPADALVWPEGAPEWLSVDAALAEPAASTPAPAPAAPAPAPPPAPAHAPAPDAAASSPVGTAPSGSTPRAASPSGSGPAGSVVPTARAAAAPSASIAPAARVAGEASSPDAGAGPSASLRMSHATTRTPARRSAPAVSPQVLAAVLGVAALLGVLYAGWRFVEPWLAKRAEIEAVKSHALPDRRIEDTAVGLVADLPAGWVALRPDNPYVTVPSARLRLAEPSVPIFASVAVVARPRHMDDLDAHLDEVLQDRVPRQPSLRPGERADVQLGRGRGRLVRTTWDEGLVPMQGETVAWADGYDIFTLDAEAPLSAGHRFSEDVAALCRGLSATGLLESRVSDAVDRLALDVPELSREALRLLVAERMSEGRGLEDVPQAALRMVSRGLDALAPAEAAEMRAIYQQVWAPMNEAERVRAAALLAEIKAGHAVPDDSLATLREAVKTGVLALTPEQRARLQDLSTRAVRKSLLLP